MTRRNSRARFFPEKFPPRKNLSALRHPAPSVSCCPVEAPRLTDAEKEALLALLDDPTPAVRQALLGHFQRLGREGVDFLKSAGRGHNRLLARAALSYLNGLHFTDPVAEFRGFIRSMNYELETGVLLLSRTANPDLDCGACCIFLDRLGARCRELIPEPATTREKCRVINRVLFHEFNFRGNTEHYTDPLNSFLDQVLQRRKGIPISLSIVYLLVAQRLGLPLEPVGAPTHFLIGCYEEDAPFFIDAFRQGAILAAGEVFALLRASHVVPQASDLAPTPVREVLCRWCRNLVQHYTAANDPVSARLFAGFVSEFEAAYERHASS